MGIGHWTTSELEAQNGLARQLVLAVQSSQTPDEPAEDPMILEILGDIRALGEGFSFMQKMAMQTLQYGELAAVWMLERGYDDRFRKVIHEKMGFLKGRGF